MKFTIHEMQERLPLPPNGKWKDGVWDVEPFEKDGVRLVFFAPRATDRQTSHAEDEFYFIARGNGQLLIGGERHDCTAGDAFFVPARVEHRFVVYGRFRNVGRFLLAVISACRSTPRNPRWPY